jgi:hypothetical protein
LSVNESKIASSEIFTLYVNDSVGSRDVALSDIEKITTENPVPVWHIVPPAPPPPNQFPACPSMNLK